MVCPHPLDVIHYSRLSHIIIMCKYHASLFTLLVHAVSLVWQSTKLDQTCLVQILTWFVAFVLALKSKSIFRECMKFRCLSNKRFDESVHMCRLTRPFAARIHNIWQKMKAQTTISTFSLVEISGLLFIRVILGICDKHYNLSFWPIYA